jgi:hypothetical protein
MKAVDEGFEFVNGKSLTSTIEKLIKSHHPNKHHRVKTNEKTSEFVLS